MTGYIEIPECIIENILLRLDHPKERVRVSVLSKKWFALTGSLPVLEFDSGDFWNKDKIYCSDVRDKFYKYVEHTVSRFCCQQNVMNAHTFKLCTVPESKAELKIIDACLELILLKGVKVLEIMINKRRYLLPDILTSASLLTFLKVSHCILPSSLMVDVPNFKSLKVLWLNDVRLDPLVIKHLTTSCPLLEELIVEYCNGFKKFFVSGLKKAHFIYNRVKGFGRIDIEAPNLCEFKLCVRHVEGRGATSVNLGLCKKLRTLCLRGSFFSTSTGLSDFLSNFPILENLSLCLVNRCNSLAISSPSLRKFVLYDQCDLEEIDIITPNLLLFNRFKVLNLDNNICGEISVDFEQLKVIQLPPYELEHVKLAEWQTNELSVVDGILWCCSPRSLSLTSYFSSISDEERSHILKYICARLLQQEDKGTANIRIEWSFPSKDRIYYSWKSVMPEIPDHNKQTLTFIKEEVSRKKKIMKPSKSDLLLYFVGAGQKLRGDNFIMFSYEKCDADFIVYLT
ncbi:F-box domain containing protein, partial [Tanacetum coccineum]